MRVYYQKEHQRITNNTDSGQRLIVTDATGDDKRATIKLSLSINDDDNDDVFYYCNGIESFKQLAEYGMGEFIVTFCWSFF